MFAAPTFLIKVTDSAIFPARMGPSGETPDTERRRAAQDSALSFPSLFCKKKREQSGCVFLLHSPVQEGVAKGIEFPEGFLRIHHQGVPRDDGLHLALHYCDEGVGGWLRPNPHAREILFQQVSGRREHSHCRGSAGRPTLCVPNLFSLVFIFSLS